MGREIGSVRPDDLIFSFEIFRVLVTFKDCLCFYQIVEINKTIKRQQNKMIVCE